VYGILAQCPPFFLLFFFGGQGLVPGDDGRKCTVVRVKVDLGGERCVVWTYLDRAQRDTTVGLIGRSAMPVGVFDRWVERLDS